jgi:hypothetical protein
MSRTGNNKEENSQPNRAKKKSASWPLPTPGIE